MTKEILWLNSEFTAPKESDFGRMFISAVVGLWLLLLKAYSATDAVPSEV